MKRSAARETRPINSWIGISRSAPRARCALRMSRAIIPPMDWLTSASGSPEMKWTTWSTSRLL